MKRKTKVLSKMMLVLTLFVFMMLPSKAFSLEQYKITIKDAQAGRTFEVYQVFVGNLNAENGHLGNIKWGNGVDETGLLQGLKNSNVFVNGEKFGSKFTDCESAYDVSEVVASFEDDSDAAKEFSQIIGEHLSSSKKTITQVNGKYEILLDPGYYFIKDSEDNKNVSYTRYILALTENQEITVKGETPILTTYVSASDYDFQVGDNITVTMEGTLPITYKDYSKYSYSFNVSLPEGVEYVNDDSLTVDLYLDDKKNTAVNLESCFVEKNGATGNFTVSCDDLTKISGLAEQFTSTKKAKIKVTYKVRTTSDVSFKNNIVSYLVYSNNPNKNKENSTTQTVKATITLYTYDLKINKVTKDETKLAGVGFKIYRKYNDVIKYAVIEDEKITDWTENLEDATEVFTNADGEINIFGLDEAEYWLTETTTLPGYDTLEDTKFEIISEINQNGLTSLKIKLGDKTENGSITDGVVSLKIVNTQGTLLPLTGGSGTTMFYIIGGILLAIAFFIIIILWKRKKDDKEQVESVNN